jgi:hypothetical protein
MTTLEKLQTIDFEKDNFGEIARQFDATEYGLDDSDIPQLLEIGDNDEWHKSEKAEEWEISCFALIALQNLKSEEGLQLTYARLNKDELNNDLEHDLLIDYSKSNPEGFFKLAEKEYDSSECGVQDVFADGIGIIAKADSTKEERAERFFVEKLKNHQKWQDHNNGFLILGLLDIGKGKKHYTLVKEAFEAGNVDESILGDLEEFEIEIGVRTEREKPSSQLYDSDILNDMSLLDDMVKNWNIEYKEELGDGESIDSGIQNEYQAELRKILSSKGRKKLNLKKIKKKKK